MREPQFVGKDGAFAERSAAIGIFPHANESGRVLANEIKNPEAVNAGLGQTGNSPQKTALLETGAAESDALAARNTPIDPDLALIIEVWPGLPEETKVGILAMVRTSGDAK